MAVGLEFWLLGPLVVRHDGLALRVPGSKPRAVLAALLLDADKLVTVDQLAEVLWGVDPPPSARVSVQNHVKRLRQTLGDAGRARIVTRPGGYVMRLEGGELDVSLFQNSLARAQRAARDGRWEQASAQASVALQLWRGEPLADAGSDLLVQRAVPYLTEIRLQAWETRLEAEVQLGHYANAVVELRRLTTVHPLREHLHALLMLALQRCGCQGEALAAYQTARQILIDELGAEPGPELRQVHRQVLAGDADVVGRTGCGLEATDARRVVVPRQLPAPVRDFVGRQAELAALTSLSSRAVISTSATLVISAIGGSAGVGKTALAVHWAHQVADQFPDGQLYINLRGFHQSRKPMTPDEATRTLLDALNVPAQRIPGSPDGQAALYRSLLSGKRMLILLDNARDAGQVRPLLPGSSGCLVLVTSRSQLPGLMAIDGAYALALDVLTDAEARELLARRLGEARLEAEPGAAAELIRLCARLPLALAIAAALASARPGFLLSSLAAELVDSRRRLDVLDAGDAAASVRAVYSWSLDCLTAPAKRVFALLGLHPGPEITILAAASLAGIPPPQAGLALDELAEAHLIAEHSPGRYAMHDLLRAYAAEQAITYDAEDQRAALHRMLDHYLYSLNTANRLLYPGRDSLILPVLQADAIQEVLTDAQQAQTWLQAERRVLLAVIAQAAALSFDKHAWQIACCVAMFLDLGGYWTEWATTQQAALISAQRAGDMGAQARIHLILAHACTRLGSEHDAQTHLENALCLYGQLHDRIGQARVHVAFSLVFNHQGRHSDAFGHAQQGLILYWSAGHQAGLAQALNAVGWSEAHLAAPQRAVACCQKAVSLHHEAGHKLGEAEGWDSQGYAYHHLGDHRQAIGCYERALAFYLQLASCHQEAVVRTRLGDVHLASGHSERARDSWKRALDVFENEHHPSAGPVQRRIDYLGDGERCGTSETRGPISASFFEPVW